MPPQPNQEPQPQRPKSQISKFEWNLLLGFFAFVDVAQILIDALLLGELLNRLDFIIGFFLGGYLWFRGYKFDTSDFLWLGGSLIAEEIPFVDAAPFWTLDVWRFRKKDLAREI